MTREKAKALLPLMQAFIEGKRIEFVDSDGIWMERPEPTFNHPPDRYRIKPERKLRPWRPEEVPIGAITRLKEDADDPDSTRGMIVGRTRKVVLDFSNHPEHPEYNKWGFSFAYYFRNYEHSLDHGKTWLPCGVEDEA